MKYPKAQSGVTKLWIVYLIGIIVTVLALFGSIFTGLFTDEAIKKIGVGAVGAGGLAGLVMLILELIGLHEASNDNVNFGHAFLIVILGLVLTFIAGVLGAFNNDIVKQIGKYVEIAGSIASIFAVTFTFKGIIILADHLGDKDMVKQGSKLIKIVWFVFILSISLSLFANIFSNGTADLVKTIVAVLAIVAAVLEIVGTILTFIYYSRAKEMLKA